MVEEVLPQVPYVQLVFTIPKMLRPYFLWDRSLYGRLSRIAYDSTRLFLKAHFPSLPKAVPAMVVSPQSFGSLLNFHPTSTRSRRWESLIETEPSMQPKNSTSRRLRNSSASGRWL